MKTNWSHIARVKSLQDKQMQLVERKKERQKAEDHIKFIKDQIALNAERQNQIKTVKQIEQK